MIKFQDRSASALLLSFFLMTLLILVGLGVSVLVQKDVLAVRTVVGGMQARYAAEGMSELGLRMVKDNLPGYELEKGEKELSFGTVSLASLQISAREDTVPCSVRNDANGEPVWRRLSYNESVQLPLFAAGDLVPEKIQNFYVEFYIGDENGNPVNLQGADVLRWKILGMKDNRTEAISEFIPLDGLNYLPENPTYFGSVLPTAAANDGYLYAKYTELGPIGQPVRFYPRMSIFQFVQEHSFNYLVMTNVVNVNNPERFYIFFKLHSGVGSNTPVVCEYVTINTNAKTSYGEASQSVNTIVKEGENLPVFDFALYHTSGKVEKEAVKTPMFNYNLGSDFGSQVLPLPN
ncbi:hypothetical protein KKC94_03420 [Patescibacteria group bacterium]|nr:hypothetical protein [Patescibacteria group bacterium]